LLYGLALRLYRYFSFLLDLSGLLPNKPLSSFLCHDFELCMDVVALFIKQSMFREDRKDSGLSL
jgi:hypothetical protein